MFCSKSFIGSGLKFRSLIHSDFILGHSVRKCSNSIFTYYSPAFPAPLIEETVFSPLCIFASLVVG